MESQQQQFDTLANSSSIGPRQVMVRLDQPRSCAATAETRPTMPSTNNSSLTYKLAGDAVVGTGVTFLMAPFVAIVDKAIAQRASGTHTLMRSGLESMQSMMTSPVAFARNPAFLYVWGVYAATYTVANSLKTIVAHYDKQSLSCNNDEQKIVLNNNRDHTIDNASMGRICIFLGTTFTNSGASVLKDRAFAQMFAAESAANSVARSVPVASYGLWLTRDLIGVGSSFVLPDLIARKLSEANPEDEKRNRDISQFCVPIATQLAAGPLHLLGLDCFNRPHVGLLERSRFLVNGYAAVVSARVARIIPGYGIAGVLNTKLRDSWREYLVEQDANTGSTTLATSTSIGSTTLERAERILSLTKTLQKMSLEL